MRIGSRDLDAQVLIVAEIGNNHEGRFETAVELVRQAAASGVDAVKVQTFRTEHYISSLDEARFSKLKSFELSIAQFAELRNLAKSLELLFMATPFDLGSARSLAPLVDAYKIASGDVTFVPLLTAVASTGKPVILSSGASTLGEVQAAVDCVRRRWAADGHDPGLAVLHCVSSYPAPEEEAHLAAISYLASTLLTTVGYSDHVTGTEAAALAVACGARIVEKHFTLNKHFSEFRDHQLSADPPEMRALVDRIRRIERLMGVTDKEIQPSERANREAIRRSTVLAVDREAGHLLAPDDVTWVRPAGGLSPGDESALVQRHLVRAVRAGDRLQPSDVE